LVVPLFRAVPTTATVYPFATIRLLSISSSPFTSGNTGAVSGNYNSVGGLVGSNEGGVISQSSNAASVSANYNANLGGLVGNNLENGSISSSHNTGRVSGTGMVGGLVGENDDSITNSYNAGDVSGGSDVGGLVGLVEFSKTQICNSYNIGIVSAVGYVHAIEGFIGSGGTIGTVSNCGWWKGAYTWSGASLDYEEFDINAFKEMIRAVKTRFRIRRVVIVCDRGMVSENNIQTLKLDGYEYVVGMRMRQLKEEDAKKILSIKDMAPVTKELKGKEVHFKDRRLIVCFNEEEALKDKKKRLEIIARLVIKLKTQGLKSLLIHKEYSKYLKIKADKPSLDEERVQHEELFDGKFVLETNTKMGWKEAILVYKDLWRVEAGFRTLKSELEMGPVYHYTERRIRAHIFISFLALVLKVTFHKALLGIDKSLSPAKVLEDVRKIKATQITLKDTPIVLRTELEGDAHIAFKAVGLKIPPHILDNPQDIQENVVVRLS